MRMLKHTFSSEAVSVSGLLPLTQPSRSGENPYRRSAAQTGQPRPDGVITLGPDTSVARYTALRTCGFRTGRPAYSYRHRSLEPANSTLSSSQFPRTNVDFRFPAVSSF